MTAGRGWCSMTGCNDLMGNGVNMTDIGKAHVKVALARHYRGQRESVDPQVAREIAAAMLVEDARTRAHAERTGPLAFIGLQARSTPAWAWAAQIALVVLMALMAQASANAALVRPAVGVLAALSVLVGVPVIHSSQVHGMAELESSCRNDCARVLVARLLVMGCSEALCCALLVALAVSPAQAGALSVLLWAALPFFCSCAGCLACLRRVRGSGALAACATWALACCGALYVFGARFPTIYEGASLWAWALAACAAACWLAREAAALVRHARAGLYAFDASKDVRTWN